MADQNPPAMFAGVKPPPPREQPKATDSTKPSASTTKASGAPVGRFAIGGAVPVLALVGAVLWMTAGPVVALIVVGSLLAIGAFATFTRSSARRRVATTTRVRPDGSITTTTRPIRKSEWNPRRRSRTQRTQRTQRDRSHSDSGNPGGRSRWFSRRHSGSPGGRSGDSGSDRRGWRGGRSKREAGRPGESKRRLRDRMPGKSRHNRDAASSPSGPGQPGSASSPAGRSKRDMPDKQAGRQQPGGGKWPWSRRRSRSDSPGTSRLTSRDSRARGGRGASGGAPADPPGRTKHPARQKNPSAAHRQGNRNDSARPSKVPTWARRIVKPASPPPDRDWTGGTARRLRGKVRDRWGSAWADRSRRPASDAPRSEDSGSSTESDTARRNWWPRRKATSATPSQASRDRRWRRQSKPEPTDFKAKLDQRWEERGIRSGPKRGVDPDNPNDPTVRRWKERVQAERQRSSAESAAFAEDWTPAPQQHGASRQSAESGLMAEGDWKPESRRAAPRSASKGGSSQVSGNSGQDASTAGGRAAAANGAANAASRVSAAKENLANALASKANAVSQREGMQAAAADLRAQASRARQDSATMAGEAGKLRQFAASVVNLFRS